MGLLSGLFLWAVFKAFPHLSGEMQFCIISGLICAVIRIWGDPSTRPNRRTTCIVAFVSVGLVLGWGVALVVTALILGSVYATRLLDERA